MGKKSKRRTGKQERRSHQKKAGAGGRVEDVSQQGASAEDVRVRVMPRRKKKDPNAPKRACSAYLHYASAMRPVVEQEFPDLSFGEKQKKIAEKFKALTKDEKAKYEDMAAKDRERYEHEMEKYTPPSDDSDSSDLDYESDVPLSNLKRKEAVKDEASAKDHAAPVSSEKEQKIYEKGEEVFEEFLMWSLSDKADLTPKKFEKMNPLLAEMILDDEDFTLDLLNYRKKEISALEEQIKERWHEFDFTEDFDIEEGLKILMKQVVHLDSEEDEAQFRQDFEEIAERLKAEDEADMDPLEIADMDPIENIFYSFQAVAYKWTKSPNACLDRIFSSRNNFDNFFQEIMFAKKLERNDGKLFQKFFSHPSARKQELKDELQKLLFSVLTLYQELNTCWECKKLDGKTLICASCKCATYCSRECQVKHWNNWKHKHCCEAASRLWSTYKRRKKRVGKALYRDKRVYAKPIKVNGIEKECFLRPCETLDFYLCIKNATIKQASIDTFYKNLAKLACGGKHILFGNETISSQLEEKIRTSYEDVISETDPKKLKGDEKTAMKYIVDKLMYPETSLERDDIAKISTRDLSVDRFITHYSCMQGSLLFGENCNRFEIEKMFLQGLKDMDQQVEEILKNGTSDRSFCK